MILTVMFWLKNTSNEPILHLGSFFFLQTIRKQNFGRKEAKILQFLFEIGPHFREIESSMQKRSI